MKKTWLTWAHHLQKWCDRNATFLTFSNYYLSGYLNLDEPWKNYRYKHGGAKCFTPKFCTPIKHFLGQNFVRQKKALLRQKFVRQKKHFLRQKSISYAKKSIFYAKIFESNFFTPNLRQKAFLRQRYFFTTTFLQEKSGELA